MKKRVQSSGSSQAPRIFYLSVRRLVARHSVTLQCGIGSVLLHGLVLGAALVLVGTLRQLPPATPAVLVVSLLEALPSSASSSKTMADPRIPYEALHLADPLPQAQRTRAELAPEAAPEAVEATAPPEVTLQSSIPGTEHPLAENRAVAAELPALPADASTVEGHSNERSRPHYGWLLETLRTRIEEVKRYPDLARSNHWQGHVVLRTRIGQTGELLELTILESSGQPLLDQDARATVSQVFPLKLREPLGHPSVVVQVPMSYRLAD